MLYAMMAATTAAPAINPLETLEKERALEAGAGAGTGEGETTSGVVGSAAGVGAVGVYAEGINTVSTTNT